MIALVLIAAVLFAWSNGMHDAGNAVATALGTGALTPRIALGMAAVLNALGAMLGVGISELFGLKLITLPVDQAGAQVVLATLTTAFVWNMLTWRVGMPTSSTQALLGGLAGAGAATGGQVQWRVIALAVLMPVVISTFAGFFGTWGLMSVLSWWWQDAAHERVLRWFRLAQSVTAALVSVGHGMQDGQKTMGVVMLALGAGMGSAAGLADTTGGAIPVSLRVLISLALAIGTLAGGWRIIRTMARRLARVDPVSGFAAEAVASTLLYVAGGAGVAVSTTMVVNSGIVGGGVVRGPRAVHWHTVLRMVATWILTPVVTFFAAGMPFWVASALGASS